MYNVTLDALKTYIQDDLLGIFIPDEGFDPELCKEVDPADVDVSDAQVAIAFADYLGFKGVDPDASTAAFEEVDTAVRELLFEGTAYYDWVDSDIYYHYHLSWCDIRSFVSSAAALISWYDTNDFITYCLRNKLAEELARAVQSEDAAAVLGLVAQWRKAA